MYFGIKIVYVRSEIFPDEEQKFVNNKIRKDNKKNSINIRTEKTYLVVRSFRFIESTNKTSEIQKKKNNRIHL